jgi:hypothetical protein
MNLWRVAGETLDTLRSDTDQGRDGGNRPRVDPLGVSWVSPSEASEKSGTAGRARAAGRRAHGSAGRWSRSSPGLCGWAVTPGAQAKRGGGAERRQCSCGDPACPRPRGASASVRRRDSCGRDARTGHGRVGGGARSDGAAHRPRLRRDRRGGTGRRPGAGPAGADGPAARSGDRHPARPACSSSWCRALPPSCQTRGTTWAGTTPTERPPALRCLGPGDYVTAPPSDLSGLGPVRWLRPPEYDDAQQPPEAALATLAYVCHRDLALSPWLVGGP